MRKYLLITIVAFASLVSFGQSNEVLNFKSDRQKDLNIVLNSIEDSNKFKEIFTENFEGLIIRYINDKTSFELSKDTFVNGREVVDLDQIKISDRNNFLILDATIYYSTYDVEIKILNKDLSPIDTLTIKLSN
ncbi:hypothetical protein [Nonlabens sp.]|uniref:hypothetical protein n=1 Tax=Nonlabens sp. TaxID=1888209 RepID=UPI003F69DA8B